MNIRWILWQLSFWVTALSQTLLIMKCCSDECMRGNICSPIEVWWFPRSGRFILLCQHNWGPIFLFSEVEVGGSALFANVIPNRSYTNSIRALFGSVVHKTDWQSERGISEMHCAILWAIAFRGEGRGEPAEKLKTYPQSCTLICCKIICKPPGF